MDSIRLANLHCEMKKQTRTFLSTLRRDTCHSTSTETHITYCAKHSSMLLCFITFPNKHSQSNSSRSFQEGAKKQPTCPLRSAASHPQSMRRWTACTPWRLFFSNKNSTERPSATFLHTLKIANGHAHLVLSSFTSVRIDNTCLSVDLVKHCAFNMETYQSTMLRNMMHNTYDSIFILAKSH